MKFPKVCDEIRSKASVKIVRNAAVAVVVKDLFNFALNTFPGVANKTIGIMTIESNSGDVYVLSISGSKTLNGNPTKHHIAITKNSSNWINTLKKNFKGRNVHIAPCFDYGDYTHTGFPTLDKVSLDARKKDAFENET